MDEKKTKKLEENQAQLIKDLLKEAEEHRSGSVKSLIELAQNNNINISESKKKSSNKNIEENLDEEDDVIYDETDVLSENYNEENEDDDEIDDFNIPYDMVPIPSKGLIYKNVKPKIPVAYLTASDEDLITSPNLYVDGRITDLLLKRKILDKNINPKTLCKADRDAISVWLRATGYGEKFPVNVKDPITDTPFEGEVDLSEIKLNEFKLKPDEKGLFDFTLPKTGHLIKFRFMNNNDENNYTKILEKSNPKIKKHILDEAKNSLINIIDNDKKIDEKLKKSLEQAADKITEYNNTIEDDGSDYIKSVTYILQKCIVSVNGNSDRIFINKYISVMPAFDAISLRRYINENVPSLDYRVTVNRPESLGGGSFTTFLDIDSSFFINVT